MAKVILQRDWFAPDGNLYDKSRNGRAVEIPDALLPFVPTQVFHAMEKAGTWPLDTVHASEGEVTLPLEDAQVSEPAAEIKLAGKKVK